MKKVIICFMALITFILVEGKSLMPPHPKFKNKFDAKRAIGETYGIRKDTVRKSQRATTVVGTGDAKPKILVLLVEFEEETIDGTVVGTHDSAKTKEYYENLISSQMKSYYEEVSYGQYDFEVEVKDWITVKNSYSTDENKNKLSYFGENVGTGVDNANSGTRVQELVKSAIKQNFEDNIEDLKSLYDRNPVDGYLDHLIVVHAGSGEEESGVATDIWSHRWDTGDTMTYGEGDSAVSFLNYTMQAEDSSLGVFTHEFGHDLGLVDLYNTSTGSSVVGGYSLMDKGSWNGETGNGETPAHMTAWEKTQLDWIEPEVLDTTETYSLKSIAKLAEDSAVADGEKYAYRINLSSSGKDYLILEYREKKGFDSYLPGGGGILIYHVYEDLIGTVNFETSMSNNNINNSSILKRFKVLEADGSNNLGTGNTGEDGDYYKNNNYGLYPYENNTPNSCYWEWTNSVYGGYTGNSGVKLKEFSGELADDLMTFKFEKELYIVNTDLKNGLKTFDDIYSFYYEVTDSSGNNLDYTITLNGESISKSTNYDIALQSGTNTITVNIDGYGEESYAITVLSVDIDEDGDFDGNDMNSYIQLYNSGDTGWDIDGDGDVDASDFSEFKSGIKAQFENIKEW